MNIFTHRRIALSRERESIEFGLARVVVSEKSDPCDKQEVINRYGRVLLNALKEIMQLDYLQLPDPRLLRLLFVLQRAIVQRLFTAENPNAPVIIRYYTAEQTPVGRFRGIDFIWEDGHGEKLEMLIQRNNLPDSRELYRKFLFAILIRHCSIKIDFSTLSVLIRLLQAKASILLAHDWQCGINICDCTIPASLFDFPYTLSRQMRLDFRAGVSTLYNRVLAKMEDKGFDQLPGAERMRNFRTAVEDGSLRVRVRIEPNLANKAGETRACSILYQQKVDQGTSSSILSITLRDLRMLDNFDEISWLMLFMGICGPTGAAMFESHELSIATVKEDIAQRALGWMVGDEADLRAEIIAKMSNSSHVPRDSRLEIAVANQRWLVYVEKNALKMQSEEPEPGYQNIIDSLHLLLPEADRNATVEELRDEAERQLIFAEVALNIGKLDGWKRETMYLYRLQRFAAQQAFQLVECLARFN